MFKCQYCGKEFKEFKSLGGHVSMCPKNPNYLKNLKNRISKDKQQKIKYRKLHPYIDFECECIYCHKKYNVYITNQMYDKGLYRKTCSKTCSCKLGALHTNLKKKNKKLKNRYKIISPDNSKSKLIKNEELDEYIKLGWKLSDKRLKKIYCPICGQKKENNQCNKEICKHTKKWFNNLIPFGFNISSIGTIKVKEEYDKVRNLLYKEYSINLLTPKEIWKKYNCQEYIKTSENLLHIIKSFNIKTRTLSESEKLGWLSYEKYKNQKINGGNYQFHDEWHTTWNNKEVYLRSSYEKDFALELDNQKINYNVESLRIKYYDSQTKNYRCAIPDFVVGNKIYEIKSKWTYDELNMKDKFKAYIELGYEPHLILEHKEIKI